MVGKVTISGLEHDWNALNHLHRWVFKNAKSYFGSATYLKAEGCVRDNLVTMGSVKLGAIEGTVSDGNGQVWLVGLTQSPGSLTATCNCADILVKAETGVKQEPEDDDERRVANSSIEVNNNGNAATCHHLAAFLLHIVSEAKVSPKQVMAFVCGGDSDAFNLRGYLSFCKSRVGCVELLSKQVSARDKINAIFTMGSVLDGRKTEIAFAYAYLENTINDHIKSSGRMRKDPIELSNALHKPLRKLNSLFKHHPNDVIMILKRVITLLAEMDLNLYSGGGALGKGVAEEPTKFDTSSLEEVCVEFILSRPFPLIGAGCSSKKATPKLGPSCLIYSPLPTL